MSAMSDIDAELRAQGVPHLDGDGDIWLEVLPGLFVFVTEDGVVDDQPLTRSEVESDCGRLVPMTD